MFPDFYTELAKTIRGKSKQFGSFDFSFFVKNGFISPTSVSLPEGQYALYQNDKYSINSTMILQRQRIGMAYCYGAKTSGISDEMIFSTSTMIQNNPVIQGLNRFALELLMPKEEILILINMGRTAEEIYNYFYVTQSFGDARLNMLKNSTGDIL